MVYKVRDEAPYKKIVMPYESVYEYRLIKPVYGGKESETTATLTYIYQHYCLERDFEEISNTLKGIAISEMHHHDMLGTAIVQLGGKPIIAGNYNYWQGSFVNNSVVLENIINYDIKMETKAIYDYREIIRLSKCAELIELINRIIADEEVHLTTLNEIKKTLK